MFDEKILMTQKKIIVYGAGNFGKRLQFFIGRQTVFAGIFQVDIPVTTMICTRCQEVL